jgi:uncharacterized protein YoxC
MKKRESIGIILIVIAVFFLLLSLAIEIYLEQVSERIKNLKEEISGTKKISLNVENYLGENDHGEG